MSTPPETSVGGPVTANGALSARERLRQSRQRIAVWLEGDHDDAHDAFHHDGTHPVAAILTELLSEWWRRHPLYASANFAGDAARNAIVPLVRRHPIAVLAVAAIAGAVVVRSRGWRWVVRPAVMAGVASQIAARVISQTPPPVDRPYQTRHSASGTNTLAPPTGRAR